MEYKYLELFMKAFSFNNRKGENEETRELLKSIRETIRAFPDGDALYARWERISVFDDIRIHNYEIWNEVLPIIDEVISLDPDFWALVVLNRISIHQKMGSYQAALKDYSDLIKLLESENAERKDEKLCEIINSLHEDRRAYIIKMGDDPNFITYLTT
jgi:tetratricopeptide (TPR) repeat protein